jgi:hypothetical protein
MTVESEADWFYSIADKSDFEIAQALDRYMQGRWTSENCERVFQLIDENAPQSRLAELLLLERAKKILCCGYIDHFDLMRSLIAALSK